MLYDKELVINGEPKNSPEQQVWQNMKDIQRLKSFIKPIYQTTATLTEESTGVLIADTNAPVGTKFGWILTEDGLFFQIEDSNETAFMLKFLSDFKGPQGTPGVDGQDGSDGVTPSITANATVDSQVGTPSVSVTKTGTDEAPTFTFAFSNLKGETGTSLIQVEVVATLPASGDSGTLYFVPNSGTSPNVYNEYIWVNNAWELLGQQQIDLSNYIQKSSTSGLLKNDGTIDTTAYTTLNSVYPVGSIYMSVNNTNPSTLFGGTWQQLKDRFLLGAGDTYSNGATGGEATHQLTINEMPIHRHDMYSANSGTFSDNVVLGSSVWGGRATLLHYIPDTSTSSDPVGIQNAGGDQAHNNMPPYLVVYIWKRIA